MYSKIAYTVNGEPVHAKHPKNPALSPETRAFIESAARISRVCINAELPRNRQSIPVWTLAVETDPDKAPLIGTAPLGDNKLADMSLQSLAAHAAKEREPIHTTRAHRPVATARRIAAR